MKQVILATALTIAGGAASAATVTTNFDLRAGGNATNQNSLSYSAGGIALSVTGMVCNDGSGPNASNCRNGKIDRSSSSGIYFNQPGDSNHEVDGSGSNEFLKLSFSSETTLDKVKFSYWDWNDDANFYTQSGPAWNFVGSISSGTSFIYEYTFNNSYTGSMFLLGARGANDNWKLKGITVESPSPVPLPAAGWLLFAGIGGLAAVRRRRKSTS